jgi:tetratricopeptide (TPR) repeat protein
VPEASRADSQELLRAGRINDAHAAALEEIGDDPGNVEALYCKAVCERYLQQPGKALQTLARLVELQPGYARAYQEMGHNHLQRAAFDLALPAFQQATRLNRGLIASWRELAKLQKHAGENAAAAEAEFRRLSELPAELVSVTSLIEEDRLYQAEKLCRAFLQKSPHHPEAMRLLAILGIRLFVYDDAEFLLESCVEMNPDFWQARLDYIKVLHKRQKFAQALEQATLLRDRYPGNFAFDLTYANQSVAVGHFDEALDVYDHVISQHGDVAEPHLSRGHALKTVGRLEDAIDSYRNAYRARADYGDAFWSLANLKTYRFTDEEIEHMRSRVECGETSTEDRFHFCFALGKAFEDREAFAESFAWYERGNELRSGGLRYDPDRAEKAMQRQTEYCTESLFEEKRGSGSERDDPIFVVGLPRSGSTLLEQVLASHSQIDGTMELPNIIATAHRLNGRRLLAEEARYPAILESLNQQQLGKFADAYIHDTAVHRQGAPRFVDKMPNNFMHVGLIHLLFPRARIIDTRRHPMGCCFSGYKQLFADGQEFTYGIETMARYYKAYVALMAHWDRVLPGVVLRVHYENVVEDTEAEIRRLLDFVGVPFEDACLEYHRTERSVRTPSSEQVRQPIYTSGMDYWRNYEPFLGRMRDALADEIDDYDRLRSESRAG